MTNEAVEDADVYALDDGLELRHVRLDLTMAN